MKWDHDTLAMDLANHLCGQDRLVWCDMQMGPVGSPRPDVWTLDKSYAHTRAMAYECKVSVADFRADVTAGKWQSYLGFSSGVYFACPAGLIAKGDVPKGCGLIVRGDVGWRTLRAPTLGVCEIDWLVARKLLIDGANQLVRPQPRRERTAWGAAEKIAKRWGQEAAQVLADLDTARARLEWHKEEAKRVDAAIADRRAKMAEEIGERETKFVNDLALALGMWGADRSAVIQRVADMRRTLEGRITENLLGRWRRGASDLRELADRLETVIAEIEPAKEQPA